MKTDVDFSVMCPRFERTAQILGNRWTSLVRRSLMETPRRLSDIIAYVDGISDRLLSERLQELEEEGIVRRKVYVQKPVIIEYALSKKGEDLRMILESFQIWDDRWLPVETPMKKVRS